MDLLIATGGSAHSHLAVHVGLDLAARLNAAAKLLFVVANGEGIPAATVTLQAMSAGQTPPLVELRTLSRVGTVVPEILAELQSRPYRLLLIGERDSHRLLTRLRGSAVDHLMGRAPCSVFILRTAVEFRRVLICDSGVEPPAILDRMEENGLLPIFAPDVDVTVLHVMSQISAGPAISSWQLTADANDLISAHAHEGQVLERALGVLQRHGLAGRAKVRHGFVVDEILAEARQGDYDLVVIGSHRANGWRSKLLEDLARQIIRRLRHSVLLVR